jgi:4-hydroxyacetophenone monooxygenase
MELRDRVAPISARDDEIRAALAVAELPPLLATLVHLTGDETLLAERLRLDPLRMNEPQGGWNDDQQTAVRDLAFEWLKRHRDSGSPVPAPPSHDLLTRIMAFTTGAVGMEPYVPLLEEELALSGGDLRAPRWTRDEIAPDSTFRVAIVGAGMSGLLVAYRLKQVGIPFVVFEKNAEVGGTWFENTYPGCRVDNPNHNYSYSFAQRTDWPFHYSTHDVLHGYFERFADEHGLRSQIQFATEVESMCWSDESRQWTLAVRGPDGSSTQVRADAVVSAVGQLNQPRMPDIPGLERFEGEAFHSARWRHDVELAGRRVAVIGTGASAMQFIPIIAETVSTLSVFQRTPAWLVPTPDYHEPIADGLRWLYAHVPFYSEWNRFWIFWRMGDGALEGVSVDPGWKERKDSVGPLNDMGRQLQTAYLQAEFGDRPDLLAKVIPDYPVGAKRMIRDNGVWARTLKRENVELVTSGILAITPEGVVDGDGIEHPVDVLIHGTGFLASRFLTPMKVTGRGGIDLHERWQGDDARAYLGVTVPDFPNFFMLYGPNTNIVVNGSIIYFSECGARYLLDCLRVLLEEGASAMVVREDVHAEFNRAIDAKNRSMAWGASDVNSWYKNSRGRSAQNWPYSLLEYWRRTREVVADEYELIA